MNWSRVWPWNWLPGKAAPARRTPIRRTVRLSPDILEDRVVPSTTTLDDAAYQLWRSQTFTVDDLPAVVDASAATPLNNSFGSQIGLPGAFANYPYRGDGYSVVVIDTGIDYNHADLGTGFGVGHRVIAGWDFVNNDADPMDDNGHGTHVAGIIGGASATYSGVAPNVNLIALKVLGATGSGSFGAVESALQWTVANRAKYNIVAVNLSLGAGNYTTNPYTYLDDEFSSLKSGGVFIAVAAGNSFYTYNSTPGLDFPAVDPYVVSVGAVWSGDFGSIAWASGARDFSTAADRIASFSQRGAGLSIMAPGALITSTYLNGAYQSMAGTSMAAPVIAGAAAILHQAMDARGLTANQDTILSVMKTTGATVIDGDDENDNVVNTGLSFKRVNLGAALNSIGMPSNTAPTLNPIATQSMLGGRTLSVLLSATDAQNDPITYSVTLVGSFATPPAGLILSGNLLTINASPDFVGSFDVRVTTSDGALSSSTTFRVNVSAPAAAYRLKGDFNGDGRQDTATFNQDGAWWLSLARADGTYANQSWGQWAAASNWRSIMTGDFNGDGKTDVIGFSNGGAWWVGLSTGAAFNQRLWAQWSAASNWNTISAGDFNGDGRTDIVGFSNTGSWWVGVSNGTTSFTTKLWAQWSAASSWSSIQFRDVNGDGKLDIIGLHKLTSKWYVGYSTGTSFRVQLL